MPMKFNSQIRQRQTMLEQEEEKMQLLKKIIF